NFIGVGTITVAKLNATTSADINGALHANTLNITNSASIGGTLEASNLHARNMYLVGPTDSYITNSNLIVTNRIGIGTVTSPSVSLESSDTIKAQNFIGMGADINGPLHANTLNITGNAVISGTLEVG